MVRRDILDLSIHYPCPTKIVIERHVYDNPYVALLNIHQVWVESVVVHEWMKLNDLLFSRLRHHLPRLSTIMMKDFTKETNNISAKQFVKMTSLGIDIQTNNSFDSHIKQICFDYLHSNNVKSLFLNQETCQEALKQEKDRRIETHRLWLIQWRAEEIENEKIAIASMTRWETELSSKSECIWITEGPTVQDDFIGFGFPPRDLFLMYIIITQNDMWSHIKKGPDGDRGYMFSCPKNVHDIVCSHPAIQVAGHSGASMALCLRLMESIAHVGSFKKWKQQDQELAEIKIE